jgi:putative flippase GtrA
MEIVKRLLLEKDNHVLQFLKYAFCGGAAFATDVVTFFLVAWFFFPALTESDILVRLFNLQVESVPEHTRLINFVICNLFSFMVGNMTAYVLNVLFVFKAGRHKRLKELGLFYLVSGASVAIGVGVGALLIGVFGLSTSFSYVAKTISCVVINYLARKFFIFHG